MKALLNYIQQQKNLYHRWWIEFFGLEDDYVRGVRLGTRSALSMHDIEIVREVEYNYSSHNLSKYEEGWIQGCRGVLFARGYTDQEIDVAFASGEIVFKARRT